MVSGVLSLLGAGRQSLLRTANVEKTYIHLCTYAARRNHMPISDPHTLTADHNLGMCTVQLTIHFYIHL